MVSRSCCTAWPRRTGPPGSGRCRRRTDPRPRRSGRPATNLAGMPSTVSEPNQVAKVVVTIMISGRRRPAMAKSVVFLTRLAGPQADGDGDQQVEDDQGDQHARSSTVLGSSQSRIMPQAAARVRTRARSATSCIAISPKHKADAAVDQALQQAVGASLLGQQRPSSSRRSRPPAVLQGTGAPGAAVRAAACA